MPNAFSLQFIDIIIFLSIGVPISAALNHCRCVPFIHTLVKCGLWPASAINTTTAISMKLLNWLEALMLESHVSIQGFCRAVIWKNNLTESQVSEIKLLFMVLCI